MPPLHSKRSPLNEWSVLSDNSPWYWSRIWLRCVRSVHQLDIHTETQKSGRWAGGAMEGGPEGVGAATLCPQLLLMSLGLVFTSQEQWCWRYVINNADPWTLRRSSIPDPIFIRICCARLLFWGNATKCRARFHLQRWLCWNLYSLYF